ncbi:phage tail protein [Treponema sp.]|uniref:phage tail protein n=1 Tax=Treponema sp. TaxID=166 RepID=UPI003F049BA4
MADNSNLKSYLFFIELDGIETARFQKCEGLEAETEVFEIEEGGGGVHRFKGRTRYPNFVLEKGISNNDELFNWFKNFLISEKVERKSGSIVLKDTEGNEIKRWNFFRAIPCRWIGPKLDCSCSNTFALERMEIAHEGIETDNDTTTAYTLPANQNIAAENSIDNTFNNNSSQLSGSAEQFAETMENLVGSSYVWGGNSPEDGGMDCSGSIIYGLNQMGNNIPDQTASDIYANYTEPVNGPLQRGDLRFLRDEDGRIVHVQTIVNSNGARVNASGGPENTLDNPGLIELIETPLPQTGEIRSLRF